MSFFSSRDKPHIILLIGDEGILCLPFQIPDAPSPFFADLQDERVRRMLALAARHSRVPVTLLADTLAQDLRRDTLPQLNFFDRAKLIRRRLQQAFPQARLTASLPVKTDRAQVLLAGLQTGGAVFEWLARFAAARPGHPARVALLPVECAGIVAKLLPRAAQDWALLLSRQRTGGFRQIVTRNGELVFTRLTPSLPFDAMPNEIAATIARDLQATRGYLGRLGLHDRAPLPAVLLLPDACHEAIRKTPLPVEDPLLITPHDAAFKLGLPFAPTLDDPYGDVVCAGWLARKAKPLLALVPDDMRQVRRTVVIRQWGVRATAALLLAAFGMAGWDASDVANVFIAREKEAAQLATLKQQLAEEQTMTAPVTKPLGRLRAALERQRLFNAPMASPWAALRKLNDGLGAETRLVKLDWQDQSGKPADEILHVDARLTSRPDIADREATAARFQQTAHSVAQAMPDYAVEVSRLPFPALPQEALSNGTADKKAEATAELSIRRVAP